MTRPIGLFLLCASFCFCARAEAQAPAPVADPALERTREFAARLRDVLELPGLAIAVARGGELVAVEQVGWSDVERAVPVQRDSRFRIGSVSKLFTAAAAARLAQAGKLDIDAPIGRYLPDLPPDKAPLTARQLAGHLAGMPHYGSDDYLNATHYDDVLASLSRLLEKPLSNPPLERYRYSSYGFNVLGAVLQRAAEKDFRQVVTDEVLTPLGLRDTLAEDSSGSALPSVRLYSRNERGELVDGPATDLSDRWPSGGFLSTAVDLARLGSGVLEPGFLSGETRELLFTPQHTAAGEATKVGLAWRVALDPLGRRFVHHGGDAVGGRAFVLLYPDEGVCVALLANLTFAEIGEEEALELAGLYLP